MRKVFILAAMLLSSIGSIAQNTAKNCYRGYVDAGYSVGIGASRLTHHMVIRLIHTCS